MQIWFRLAETTWIEDSAPCLNIKKFSLVSNAFWLCDKNFKIVGWERNNWSQAGRGAGLVDDVKRIGLLTRYWGNLVGKNFQSRLYLYDFASGPKNIPGSTSSTRKVFTSYITRHFIYNFRIRYCTETPFPLFSRGLLQFGQYVKCLRVKCSKNPMGH